MRTIIEQKLVRARVEAERAALKLAAAIASGLANDAPPHMIDGLYASSNRSSAKPSCSPDDGAVIRVLAPLGEAIRIAARTRDPDDIQRLADLVFYMRSGHREVRKSPPMEFMGAPGFARRSGSLGVHPDYRLLVSVRDDKDPIAAIHERTAGLAQAAH